MNDAYFKERTHNSIIVQKTPSIRDYERIHIPEKKKKKEDKTDKYYARTWRRKRGMQRTIKTIWFHVRLIAVSFVFRGESIRKSIMCGPASVYTCVPKNICGTLCNIIQSFSYSCVICARTNGYTHRELHSLLFFPFNGCALRPSKQRSRCAACSL